MPPCYRFIATAGGALLPLLLLLLLVASPSGGDDNLLSLEFEDPEEDYVEVGISLGNLDRPDLAAEAFAAAIRFQPGRTAAYLNLAGAELSGGESPPRHATEAILKLVRGTRFSPGARTDGSSSGAAWDSLVSDDLQGSLFPIEIEERYAASLAGAAAAVAEAWDGLNGDAAGEMAAELFRIALAADRENLESEAIAGGGNGNSSSSDGDGDGDGDAGAAAPVLNSKQLVSAGLALYFHGADEWFANASSPERDRKHEALALLRCSLVRRRGHFLVGARPIGLFGGGGGEAGDESSDEALAAAMGVAEERVCGRDGRSDGSGGLRAQAEEVGPVSELGNLTDVVESRLGRPWLHKIRFDVEQFEYLVRVVRAAAEPMSRPSDSYYLGIGIGVEPKYRYGASVVSKGSRASFFLAAADAHRFVLQQQPNEGSRGGGDDNSPVEDDATLLPVAGFLGRPVYVRTGEVFAPPQRILAADLTGADADWARAATQQQQQQQQQQQPAADSLPSWQSRPPIVVVDDVLSAAALASVRRLLLESTLWFDGAKPSGYVGAYVNEGLSSEVLLGVAEELRKGLPSALKDQRLWHLWAYSYESPSDDEKKKKGDDGPGKKNAKAKGGPKGISLHADFAAVNVNLWITPDEHNLSPGTGGLRIFHRLPPKGAAFSDYNCPPGDGFDECHDRLLRFVGEANGESGGGGGSESETESGDAPNCDDDDDIDNIDESDPYRVRVGATSTLVPYKANRVVIFDSSLLHATDEYHFKPTDEERGGKHEHRRINLTYLFGKGGAWAEE